MMSKNLRGIWWARACLGEQELYEQGEQELYEQEPEDEQYPASKWAETGHGEQESAEGAQ